MWKHTEAHPGAFLRARFLEPLGLSASALATGCRMPRSRVSDILTGKRSISADTALRLGAFFRMEPEQWLALQADWDLSQVGLDMEIVPLDPPGFLLGPLGATPLATRRPRRPSITVPEHHRAELLAAESAAAAPHEPRVHEEVRYADGTRALVVK
jgi:antitoxin HigA-1